MNQELSYPLNIYSDDLDLTNEELETKLAPWKLLFIRHHSLLENQPMLKITQEVLLDFRQLYARLQPFNEKEKFLTRLRDSPQDALALIAFAIHTYLIKTNDIRLPRYTPNSDEAIDNNPYSLPKIHVYIKNFDPILPLHLLRSSIVGKLVSVRGNVIKINSIKPLATSLTFTCLKCGNSTIMPCKDGRYETPNKCNSKRCIGKNFAPNRRSATTIDWQKIRLQEEATEMFDTKTSSYNPEHSNDHGGRRMALTVDCELSRSLVDTCVPGDVVTIVGIVKAAPSTNSGGHNTSIDTSNIGTNRALYMLYIDAISVVHQRTSKQNGNSSQGTSSGWIYQNFAHLWKDYESEALHTCSPSEELHTPFIDLDTEEIKANEISPFSEKALEFVADVYQTVERRFELLVASLSPHILGNYLIKAGLILVLLGGIPIMNEESNVLKRRGDIHCLLIGDPGLGKSQLLRYACTISERGVYVCGSSSSTTGLTASVTKDTTTGEFALEAGALTLADQGLCCIDELDKMPSSEQFAFLETMEQQTVSVAKAGIVCSLSARASVIAAANPKGGKYQETRTLSENVSLPAPLISRFDMVFLMRDEAQTNSDTQLSSHVLKLRGAQPGKGDNTVELNFNSPFHDLKGLSLEERIAQQTNSDLLPPSLIQTYIRYSRTYCRPKLSSLASKRIKDFYLQLRKQPPQNQNLIVTTRQLEALIRLSQARCRADLCDEVTENHVDDVIEIYKATALYAEEMPTFLLNDESFSSSQKGSRGKSFNNIISIFKSQLKRKVFTDQTSNINKKDMRALARQILTSLQSSFEPEHLIEIVNNEGFILNKNDHWEVKLPKI